MLGTQVQFITIELSRYMIRSSEKPKSPVTANFKAKYIHVFYSGKYCIHEDIALKFGIVSQIIHNYESNRIVNCVANDFLVF